MNTQASQSAPLNGPAALRALAAAFAHVEDFDGFVGALQRALDRSAPFERTQIRLDRAMLDAETHFSAGAMSLPLAAGGRGLGTLQVVPATRRSFGAEDLHLMAGLADFLSAALGLALRAEDAGRAQALLRLLLNQAPAGIAAFGVDRRPIVANDLAVRWLGATQPPFAEIEAGATTFHLRVEGRLICGEARRLPEEYGGAWVLVLHDLAPEQGRLLEGLAREVYRGLAEGSSRSLVLLEAPGVRHGALSGLGAVRSALVEGELAGPYDANRVALVLPRAGLALRSRLRELRAVLGGAGELRAGRAELGRDGRDPEAMLKAALQRVDNLDTWLRPALLLHGGHPAAVEAMARVLAREYRVARSESPERARTLLERECFEGVLTDADDRAPREEVVRFARSVQPGIRVFVATVRGADEVAVEAEDAVIEKPFDVVAFATLVRSRLGV